MSTAPTGWQNPKADWQAANAPLPADLNRIEGNAAATETGERTIDTSQAPSGNVGSLRQLLDWFANRLKAITGTTNWYDTPPTTLSAAKTHIDAAAPHSGHETPSGAQAKVDAHASQSAPHSGHATTTALNAHTGATSAHSATSAATANRIMMRDASGRVKVAAPSAADDVARKDTVDAVVNASTGHKHTGATNDAPKIDPAAGLTWLPLRVISGSYVGDDTYSRVISVGAAAKLVIIIASESGYGGDMAVLNNTNGIVHGTNWHDNWTTMRIDGNSFIVGVNDKGNSHMNKSGVTHYWFAFV